MRKNVSPAVLFAYPPCKKTEIALSLILVADKKKMDHFKQFTSLYLRPRPTSRNPKALLRLAVLQISHHLDVDPNPAFYLYADADPDPAPHQSDAKLRPLVYRTSKAPF